MPISWHRKYVRATSAPIQRWDNALATRSAAPGGSDLIRAASVLFDRGQAGQGSSRGPCPQGRTRRRTRTEGEARSLVRGAGPGLPGLLRPRAERLCRPIRGRPGGRRCWHPCHSHGLPVTVHSWPAPARGELRGDAGRHPGAGTGAQVASPGHGSDRRWGHHAPMHDNMRPCLRPCRSARSMTRCTRRFSATLPRPASPCPSCCAGRRPDWPLDPASRSGWQGPGAGGARSREQR